jgi:hypothetical protein
MVQSVDLLQLLAWQLIYHKISILIRGIESGEITVFVAMSDQIAAQELQHPGGAFFNLGLDCLQAWHNKVSYIFTTSWHRCLNWI